MDTLQFRNLENKIIRDSLVLSSNRKIERIEEIEFLSSILLGGGQNRYKPPDKMFWKRNRLYRIKENGTLELGMVESFWSRKKYKTYFKKEK